MRTWMPIPDYTIFHSSLCVPFEVSLHLDTKVVPERHLNFKIHIKLLRVIQIIYLYTRQRAMHVPAKGWQLLNQKSKNVPGLNCDTRMQLHI